MKVKVERVFVRGSVYTRDLPRHVVERAVEKVFEPAGSGKVWVGGRAVELADIKIESAELRMLFAVRQDDVSFITERLDEELKKLQKLIDMLSWIKEMMEILEIDVNGDLGPFNPPKTFAEVFAENRIDVIC